MKCLLLLLLVALCGCGSSPQSTSVGVGGSGQTPALVQTIATGREQTPTGYYGSSPYILNFYHLGPKLTGTLAGNCLAIVTENDTGLTIATPTDDKGNIWHRGPDAVNISEGQEVTGWYTTPATGTQHIQIPFTGSSTQTAVSVNALEFTNSNCTLDTSGGGTGQSVALSTTTTDMLWEVGVDDSSLDPMLTSITAGSGFTLLTANREAGLVSQWEPSVAPGSHTCSFATSGSDTWQSVCMAFQIAPGGTAPTGMYIAHAAGEWLGEVGTKPHTMQFPSQGNLIVGVLDDYQTKFSAVSDSNGNTWNLGTSALNSGSSTQILYAANAAASPTLTISPTYNETENQGLNFVQWFDIVGAATSPYDTAHGTTGTAGGATLTTDTITPSGAGELVFNVTSVYYGTGIGMSTPGALYSYAWDTWDDDAPHSPSSWNGCATAPSHLQDDSPRAVMFSTGNTAITFTYSMTSAATNWASTSMAFK